jgi:hypothetical protein
MKNFAEKFFFEDFVFGIDKPGFYVGELTQPDRSAFKDFVLSSYHRLIEEFYPGLSVDPEFYHLIAEDKIHKLAFTQKARTLSEESANKVMNLEVINTLFSRYPDLNFSKWESGTHPDFIWRIVRPGQIDLSPIHSDKWFWDVGLGKMPEHGNYRRVKCWIPILTELGQSGLSVYPGSHKIQYQPSYEIRDGLKKPFLDQKLFSGKMKNLPLHYGAIVFFNDNLIHGGFSNGLRTRLSLEFTMLIPEK